MSNLHGFRISRIVMTTRFIQGYRYLDRCGEALVRLEDCLDKNWIPSQPVPTGGSIKNDAEQMAAQFDSEQVTVSQTDFCNFELFQDATSRIFETLCHTFGVLTVNAPALRVIAQKGCESLEDAQKQLDKFEFMSPNERLKRVLGTQSAFQFTYCSEEDVEWNGIPVARRRRFNAAAIGQQRQVGFDERLLKRVRMLDKRQSEALSALLKVRSQLPEIPPFAIQFDLEHLYETEFKTEALDMSRFLADTWNWLEETISILAHK